MPWNGIAFSLQTTGRKLNAVSWLMAAATGFWMGCLCHQRPVATRSRQAEDNRQARRKNVGTEQKDYLTVCIRKKAKEAQEIDKPLCMNSLDLLPPQQLLGHTEVSVSKLHVKLTAGDWQVGHAIGSPVDPGDF